jgi:hypothetical protein
MRYLRYLIESRRPLLREPDQSFIVGETSPRAVERNEALRASDGSYAFVYIQQGKPVTVNMGKLSGTSISSWWYDPRTGKAEAIDTAPKTQTREFTPPAAGQDWVLILEDAAVLFNVPAR